MCIFLILLPLLLPLLPPLLPLLLPLLPLTRSFYLCMEVHGVGVGHGNTLLYVDILQIIHNPL